MAPDCLTEEQATALATMYGGARNPRTGEAIYYGWPKGSENSGPCDRGVAGLEPVLGGPGAFRDRPARTNFWKIWAFDDPNWDWTPIRFRFRHEDRG